MAAGLERSLQAQGMGMIPPAQGRQLFGYLLQRTEELPGQVGVLPQRTPQAIPSTRETLRFNRQAYARHSPDEQQALIVALLQQTLMRVGGFSVEQVSLTESLLTIGIDSLMAVEWRMQIEQLFALRLPLSRFLEGGSLNTIALLVMELLAQWGDQQVVQQLQPPGTPRIDVDALFLSGSHPDGNDPDGRGEGDDDTFAEGVV